MRLSKQLSLVGVTFLVALFGTTYAKPLELANVMPSELTAIGVTPSRWQRTVRQYENVRALLKVEHISDTDILSMIIWSEFRGLPEPYYTETLGALSNQYFSRVFCYGSCVSTYEQLRWLTGFQGWYANTPEQLIQGGRTFTSVAKRLTKGEYKGHEGWVWGEYDYWGYGTSLMGQYIRGEIPVSWTKKAPYLFVDESLRFVILDRARAYDCQLVDCLGLQKK